VLATGAWSADEAELLVGEVTLAASHDTLDRGNIITSKCRTSIMNTAEESQSARTILARFRSKAASRLSTKPGQS
jgi:hypothetical protein